jgi:hypothetical protein
MKTKRTAFCCAAFFLLAAAIWAQTNPASDFSYDLNAAGDGVVIKSYIGNTSGKILKVVIPGTIEGYPVTEIGDRAFSHVKEDMYYLDDEVYEPDVYEVIIPNSVTVIGKSVFEKTRLSKVTLSNKLLTIGGYAFSTCRPLTAINLPGTLTSIGDRAFYYCKGLTAITIPASVTSIGEKAFSRCDKLATLTFAAGSKLETLGKNVFSEMGLTAVTIPASVTSIGAGAFSDCEKLKTVTFAAGSLCTSIGEKAFYDDQAITEISIPESVTVIGNGAFEGCGSLVKVTMPAHPITYGNNPATFSDCPRLTLASRKAITDTGYTDTF